MNRLKYLSKNLALFSVSNFVTKILVFLLVPLYTGVLTTYEYGVADVIQVTLLLLVPMLTMNIGEAALRFGIENSESRGSIFRIGLKYVTRAYAYAVILTMALGILINTFIKDAEFVKELKWYFFLFVLLFMFNALYEFLILYFQGCESVDIIVYGSITCTALTIAFNLIFLLIIKIGLNGYIFSQVLAFLFAGALMILLGHKKNIIRKCEFNDTLEEAMTEYSKPMIVYSTASWVNNAVDRYFVLYMCGASVNGVYGVAYKIPAILMVFQRIFAQAWQMSATKTLGDSDSDYFYTKMFKMYNALMLLGCALLILIVKPVSAFLFRKDFFTAWRYVPPLLISVIFGALTGFLGSICLAHKDSKSMGAATAIGAFVNVVLNACLIPHFSAMGAAVATGISYFTMCAFALFFVKRYVKLNVNILLLAISYILVVCEAVIMIREINYYYLITAVIFMLLLLMHINEIKEIVKDVSARLQKSG